MTDFDDIRARAQAGDEAFFAELFRQWQPPLLRYLRSVARPAEEDIAGDVWLDVIRGLPGFSGGEADFRRWLFTIAHRRAVDWHRSQARHRVTPMADVPCADTVAGAAEQVDEQLSTASAVALIAQLPAAEAEVVLLRVIAGLDVAAVAAIVGRRPGTVRVQSHRGLTRLAQILAGRPADVTNPTPPSI